MLRLALLENLRRVAVHVMAGRRERERAAYWVEQMLEVSAKDPAKVVLVLADMVRENPPLTNAFVAEFASRLQGQGPALVFAVTWLEQRLAEQGQTIEQVFQQASQNQAADQVSIGNSIGSLRFLGATEWRDFVEAMSVVEHALRADPAGVYAAMDFATRDHYRHAVEQIAKRSRLSEDEVARQAVDAGRRRRRCGERDGDASAPARRPRRLLPGRPRPPDARARGARAAVAGDAAAAARPTRSRWRRTSAPIVAAHGRRHRAACLWWAARHRASGRWASSLLGVLLVRRREPARGRDRPLGGDAARAAAHPAAHGLRRAASRPSTGRSVAVPTMLTDAAGGRRAARGAGGALPGQPRREPLVRAAQRLPRRRRGDDAGATPRCWSARGRASRR